MLRERGCIIYTIRCDSDALYILLYTNKIPNALLTNVYQLPIVIQRLSVCACIS